MTYFLSSSVRTRPVEETLHIAELAARKLGVTRCVDLTRMDRVGIPVFSATRPRAPMVCVTAGKGCNPREARVGALMEAIEQQVAWEERTWADPAWMTWLEARALGALEPEKMAPRLGAVLAPERRIPWLACRQLDDPAAELSVPAELVLTPCPPGWSSGVFGSSTTGLASGNGFDDAVLHGLCEVLERDISSFEVLRPTSRLVRPASLPPQLWNLRERLNAQGLRAWLRWVPSSLGVAYFAALVVDDDQPTPLFCNGGYGCHPSAAIAAARALTEAAQSRVAFIQGAREDLTDTYSYFAARSDTECDDQRRAIIERYSDPTGAVEFDHIPTSEPASPRALTERIVDHLDGTDLGPVITYSYQSTPTDLTVVRVLVPGAEQLRNATRRVGGRLIRYARTLTSKALVSDA